MPHATVNQILDQIKTLQPDELQELREAVQEQLRPHEEAHKRQAFHQALVRSGLVKRLADPRGHSAPARRLVPARGKPVSETILEERR